MTKEYIVLHLGTGTYFGLDDGVILIDTDTMTEDQKWEMAECGEVPDGVGGEDLVSLLPWKIVEHLYAEPSEFQANFPQTEDEARECRHGNLYWFGHECGLCEDEGYDGE